MVDAGHVVRLDAPPAMHAPAQPCATRVLAIDPSLRSTGFAVLERGPGGKLRALEYGTIKNHPKLLQSGCLVAIRERVQELIQKHAPECAAFEAIIYVQSFRTAITMGCARGAALLAAAERGLPIFEYAPRRVKQAIVGRGGADKGQVSFMVRALLGLTETPPADAADALAIGMTHFQTADSAMRGVALVQRI
jgi:crossover junction endodeoxyribonuclease RuvC